MLSVLSAALVGLVAGAWGSMIAWSLGGALVVVLCIVFVVVTASSWLFVPASILAYGVAMVLGLVLGPLRRARRAAHRELAPASSSGRNQDIT